MTSLVRWFAMLPLLSLAAVPACSSGDDASDPTPVTQDPGTPGEPGTPSDETGDEDEVVDTANTGVKNQAIGNCWIYATAAWAESLRLNYAGEELNISESYLSYIDWYHGIQAGEFSAAEGIQTGGWFGEAAEYLRRYGVMDEAAFIPEEAKAEKSARQKIALDAINASLKTGALSTAAARKDRKLVKKELDAAFKLSPAVIALLDESFGNDLSRTVLKGATIPAGKGLRKASEIEVGYYKPKSGGTAQIISLNDALGTPQSETSEYTWRSVRTGKFAWSDVNYPSNATSQRNFQIKAQKVMHQRWPLLVTWFVDFNAMDSKTGVFAAVPSSIGRQGGHMVVTEDYQVSNVPGFGTLAAGTVVTDPKALEAALKPEAKIDFFRVKNSWSSNFAPAAGTTDLKGYHDLYMAYLNGMIPVCDKKDDAGKCISPRSQRGLTAMVFPSDAWTDVSAAPTPVTPPPNPTPDSTCTHSTCATGSKLVSSCDPCAAKICAEDPYCCSTAWDGQCVSEVASICKLTCSK